MAAIHWRTRTWCWLSGTPGPDLRLPLRSQRVTLAKRTRLRHHPGDLRGRPVDALPGRADRAHGRQRRGGSEGGDGRAGPVPARRAVGAAEADAVVQMQVIGSARRRYAPTVAGDHVGHVTRGEGVLPPRVALVGDHAPDTKQSIRRAQGKATRFALLITGADNPTQVQALSDGLVAAITLLNEIRAGVLQRG